MGVVEKWSALGKSHTEIQAKRFFLSIINAGSFSSLSFSNILPKTDR